VAVSGCGFMIYQAVDQFCQFDVITMTKIKRETNMTFPAVTICSPDENTYTMIIECRGSSGDCKMNNLTLYNRNNHPEYCAQLNYEKNVTYEGSVYYLTLYQPKYTYLLLAITDNSARVVLDEVSVNVYAGQETDLVLSKTVQTVLGPPYSDCNQSTDYIQATCLEDCDKIALKEACGSGYDTEFQWLYQMSEKCHDAYYKLAGIVSKCNQECPVECNQVSFQKKRVDIEFYMNNDVLHYFKSTVAKKFNISEYNDDEFKKRMTKLFIGYDKLETTVITQSPSISLTSLIANVGGLLGKSLHSPCIF